MNHYLLKTIEFPPIVLSQIISKLPAGQVDVRVSEDRFTLREAVAHLADWEPIFRERIELVVKHPGSTITVYDEGQFAIDRNYAAQDVRENLKRYAQERKVTAKVIHGLSQEDLGKRLNHPELGDLSLDDLVNMILGHDMYHIEHAASFL